jgi:acetyl-CoA acetyltransferase
MSNAPYLLPQGRKGFRMGDSTVVDSMVKDSLWCACDDQHMGMTAELVAEKHSISREMQDAYALEPHRRAVMVMSAGKAKELGLKPMVTIKVQAMSGVAPKWIMLAPVIGVRRDAKKGVAAFAWVGGNSVALTVERGQSCHSR